METNEKRYRLKVDKNNTITISKVKESWSREEVQTLIKRMCEFMSHEHEMTLEEWFKRNL